MERHERLAAREAKVARIAEYIRQGWSRRRIAESEGCSPPAISQFIRATPTLRLLNHHRGQTDRERLYALRLDLVAVSAEADRVRRLTRQAIRELDDELLSLDVDHLNGLR